MMKRFLVFLLLLGLASCDSGGGSPEGGEQVNKPVKRSLPQGEPVNILFVGNSHTYYNGGVGSHLSKMLVEGEPSGNYFISDLTASGATLEEHLENEITAQRLQERDWDIVVLQENSFVAYTQPEVVPPSVRAFNTAINNRDTKIYVFMTWAYKDNPSMYPVIRQACETAAAGVSGTVVPVGVAFEQVRLDPELPLELHDPDQFHPSAAGTFLAASVFYAVLSEKDPGALEYAASLNPSDAQLLKMVAWETVTSYGD